MYTDVFYKADELVHYLMTTDVVFKNPIRLVDYGDSIELYPDTTFHKFHLNFPSYHDIFFREGNNEQLLKECVEEYIPVNYIQEYNFPLEKSHLEIMDEDKKFTDQLNFVIYGH